MLDNERAVLKGNAEELANLLTENVPSLLSHYLGKDVLTEGERETIISAGSAHEINLKLFEILSDKEGISLEDIIEGLNATENFCVSKELRSLLPGRESAADEDSHRNGGAGDQIEDVSLVAAALVDEVISTAKDKTNYSEEEDGQQEEGDDSGNMDDSQFDDMMVAASPVNNENSPGSNLEEEEELSRKEENLVEASVEVHKEEEKENDAPPEEVQEEKEQETIDVPDRGVKFHENVATIIDDDANHHHYDTDEDTKEAPEDYQRHGVDAPTESEMEDVDNIDIEKEFVMPTEAETNNNGVSNGISKMESNEIILDGEEETNNKVNGTTSSATSTGDEGLDSIMARKALVKQQVQMFEKSSPGQGTVKYNFKTPSSVKKEEAAGEVKSDGTNVKNLKNFFQRLSTNKPESATPPSAAVKPVGKLKVTFPAS